MSLQISVSVMLHSSHHAKGICQCYAPSSMHKLALLVLLATLLLEACPAQHDNPVQLDPKAIAREQAKVAKAEAKAQQQRKEASSNHKLTGFFRPLRAAN